MDDRMANGGFWDGWNVWKYRHREWEWESKILSIKKNATKKTDWDTGYPTDNNTIYNFNKNIYKKQFCFGGFAFHI